MNNHPSEHNVQQIQRRVGSRPIAPRLPLLTTSFIAAAVAMALAWQTALAVPDGAPSGGTIATDAISLASGANAAGTPAASISAASAPPAQTAPDAPAALAQQLAEIQQAYARLLDQAQQAEQRIERIETDVTQLRHQLAMSRAAQTRAQRQSKALARQLRATRAATFAQAGQPSPAVLSVDTWNGRPSVSVQVGKEVRFFSEGDHVGNALVRRADPATQRVEFVGMSGPASAAPADVRGEAR
jgi:hypothetical protein